MPDIEKIKKHLAAMVEDIENLEKHKGISASDLKSNLDLLWIVERGIYLAVQNLFDILAHIVSADFNTQWESYADIAQILFQKKIIDENDQNILIQMAGFRNRLSHDYLSLDPDILIDILHNRLIDFKRFQKMIITYCDL
jgi:uncharacterized protein YutE (UPF0331/DUF86 family)